MERAEAIKIIKSVTVYTPEEMEALETLIPELAGREGERMRKEIISIVKAYRENCIDEGTHRFDDCLSWLEKQKESLHIPDSCKENADSFTDIKNRNIRGCIGMALADVPESRFWAYGVTLKECLAYLEKHKEQKPAEWSEEDEEMRKRAICACNFTIKMIMREDHYGKARDWLRSLPNGFIVNPNHNEDMVNLLVAELQSIAERNDAPRQYDAEISWLKSLRPQPKQEWSEEDEETYKWVCCLFRDATDKWYECVFAGRYPKITKKKVLAMLNSLRPSWKPSEEQEEPEYYQHFDPDC